VPRRLATAIASANHTDRHAALLDLIVPWNTDHRYTYYGNISEQWLKLYLSGLMSLTPLPALARSPPRYGLQTAAGVRFSPGK
jgi:hypothetical protein